MSNFNKVVLMGNLTRDPETRFTTKGTCVCGFTMAVNRKYYTEAQEAKEEVTFVDVDVWGRMAEAIGKHARRGKCLLIEGRLKLDTWEDKATGAKRSKLGVVAEQFQFVGPRDPRAPASETQGAGPKAATRPPEPAAPQDDIPF